MSGEMVQILIVLATIAVHVGSALHVEVWPKVVNQHVTDVVDVYCHPNDTPVWKAHVIVVELGKTGQSPMVIVLQSGLRLGKNLEARMTAEGHIDEVNITESFVKLSIKEPTASDGGQYVCKIFYMDAQGSLKERKAFGNVTVDNNNNEVVHTHLLKRLSELEKQLRGLEDHTKEKDAKVETELDTVRRQHEKDIDTLKTQHEKDIDTLNTQNVKQNKEHEQDIATLKTQLMTLENQTTNHITKANLQSGFMAGLKSGDFLLYHKTNKFSDVQLNIGSNFDADTSVYTAPWDGLYTFYLTVWIGTGKYCNLDIRVNGRVVSRLYARDGDYSDQSSVNAFVSLQAGDTVDVYGYAMSGSTKLSAFYAYPWTSFSGFLVKAT